MVQGWEEIVFGAAPAPVYFLERLRLQEAQKHAAPALDYWSSLARHFFPTNYKCAQVTNVQLSYSFYLLKAGIGAAYFWWLQLPIFFGVAPAPGIFFFKWLRLQGGQKHAAPAPQS